MEESFLLQTGAHREGRGVGRSVFRAFSSHEEHLDMSGTHASLVEIHDEENLDI